jgi:hypothetical protein
LPYICPTFSPLPQLMALSWQLLLLQVLWVSAFAMVKWVINRCNHWTKFVMQQHVGPPSCFAAVVVLACLTVSTQCSSDPEERLSGLILACLIISPLTGVCT